MDITKLPKEDKMLLIKDLSARQPYGVCIEHTSRIRCTLHNLIVYFIYNDDGSINDYMCYTNFFGDEACKIEYFKPYLFPLSSMSDEMLEELNANGFFKYRDTITNVSHLVSNDRLICKAFEEIYTYIDIESISFLIEFFHKHHIDYRGLIEKGLAIDATGKNIY